MARCALLRRDPWSPVVAAFLSDFRDHSIRWAETDFSKRMADGGFFRSDLTRDDSYVYSYQGKSLQVPDTMCFSIHAMRGIWIRKIMIFSTGWIFLCRKMPWKSTSVAWWMSVRNAAEKISSTGWMIDWFFGVMMFQSELLNYYVEGIWVML